MKKTFAWVIRERNDDGSLSSCVLHTTGQIGAGMWWARKDARQMKKDYRLNGKVVKAQISFVDE